MMAMMPTWRQGNQTRALQRNRIVLPQVLHRQHQHGDYSEEEEEDDKDNDNADLDNYFEKPRGPF